MYVFCMSTELHTEQDVEAAPPTGRNIRLTVEYDGTNYVGWQFQINGISVQQRLEEALKKVLGHSVRVTAAGRTDSGVHAAGQVVNFFTENPLPCRAIQMEALRRLPNDIAVMEASEVPPDFDARRSATMRWYKFHLLNRLVMPTTGRQYVTHVRGDLDFAAMEAACDILAGHHNFQAFRYIECQAKRTNLTLRRPRFTRLEEGHIVFDYMARSFLHNMVRIMTGAIIACGRGQLEVEGIRRMLETGVRPVQAVTLAPNGLFLYKVFYGDEPPE